MGSVSHAAANFSQYDDYAFPANYPAILHGKPPTDKVNEMKYFIVSLIFGMWELGDLHSCSLDVHQAQINLRKTISDAQTGTEPATI